MIIDKGADPVEGGCSEYEASGKGNDAASDSGEDLYIKVAMMPKEAAVARDAMRAECKANKRTVKET